METDKATPITLTIPANTFRLYDEIRSNHLPSIILSFNRMMCFYLVIWRMRTILFPIYPLSLQKLGRKPARHADRFPPAGRSRG
ncbi:MAG TPA: hypothetical protein DDZ96_02625 [Porphyromonadaceae bacterium]|nr:hypothetical protein [Porphyromonadaceae bacterium]HBK31411.1 hypothetical protein [Porphyromonadaceae bacterium]HBL32701.1 hypothetical protein [Porphyromonadaceae bacterium]HBX21904.1 hypothetical protein [Porphyromonadaceae bacterium]HCM21459.1 hypothetical protein [Porphyromonadaceae bacterium]